MIRVTETCVRQMIYHLRMSEKVVFNLIGGIGNQLFILMAARFVKRETSLAVELLAPPKKSKFGHRNSSLSCIEETGVEIRYQKRIKLLRDRLMRRLNWFKPAILKNKEKVTYSPKNGEIGFDEDLVRVQPGTFIDGYFQSWRYFEELKEKEDLKLQILNPSDWYLEMKRIISDKKSAAIHIRRGDYETSNIGVLSREYYLSALQTLSEKSSAKHFFVFSDEPQKAKEIFEPLTEYCFSFIEPPEHACAVESLFLMAEVEAIVIANSTFSWWSAMLSKKGTLVICPDKWFENAQDPRDLIPPHWFRIPSLWK